ncbi:zinc finger and SCAN domain-containing protein 31-like [Phyllopteryx taeniolatus]|uniref:zinc finger and SCAN domain-containing protein 31-like n=1 Tax=Phyllopteryx taeniolatus TaxID=161469 RepID=UPI002AD39487|nr:zinc finger and SCAN domain-containing protein 31-like [Phyllopteryx taeniolatus]
MCKVQILRALVNQRLNAAVEEIFVAFETTMAEYEEELCRSKQEIERQRRLLDAVCKPRVELRRHKADVPPEQQQHESVPSDIKEEEKVGEQLEQLAEFPGRSATSQDDGEERARPHRRQREETGESSDHHTVTQAHKCHFGQPQNSDMTSAYAADGTKAKPQNHENFICSDCGKTFSRPAGLKRHIRSHAGDKPFSCSFCRRSFKHRSTLERHTRVHTGEKPFSCSLCSSTFSRRTGPEETHEDPHGREALRLLCVPRQLHQAQHAGAAHENAHGREALRLQVLRQDLLPAG